MAALPWQRQDWLAEAESWLREHAQLLATFR